VSMGMTSARHARDIVGNAETVLALEALAAAQALDLRSPLEAAAATAAARDAVRADVTFYQADREFAHDIDAALALVRSGALVAAAERVTGPLA
jgi:histidine ammonia-lyase